jgi:DNA-binding FadR family transcriptional regulator
VFRELNRAPSLAAQCVEEIRAAILSGELRPGQKLMPERELAEELGVNRVTLRNALGQLQAAGLIRAKQGSGYTVEEFRIYGGPELLPSLARTIDDVASRVAMMEDLLLMRRHLAHAALSKLASMQDVDLEGIVLAFERFERACALGEPEDIAEADVDMIAEILDATESPVFRLALNPIAAAIDALPELRELLYREPESNIHGYRLLLGWLHERESAAIEMLVHVLAQRDARTVELLREESCNG